MLRSSNEHRFTRTNARMNWNLYDGERLSSDITLYGQAKSLEELQDIEIGTFDEFWVKWFDGEERRIFLNGVITMDYIVSSVLEFYKRNQTMPTYVCSLEQVYLDGTEMEFIFGS